ncbi:MAG: pyridoxamine 5'-phosphate oxidase family protein [Pseudomonadales bacterium]
MSLETARPSKESLLSEMRQVMKDAGYPALITVDEQGQPRARTVDAFAPDASMTIWVATRPNTRKVAQIQSNSAVTLYYFDASSRSYVTLMGEAELIDDEATKKDKRRDRDGDRLYPDFPNDYLLIKIKPSYVEALIPSYRGDPHTWAPIRVDLVDP